MRLKASPECYRRPNSNRRSPQNRTPSCQRSNHTQDRQLTKTNRTGQRRVLKSRLNCPARFLQRDTTLTRLLLLGSLIHGLSISLNRRIHSSPCRTDPFCHGRTIIPPNIPSISASEVALISTCLVQASANGTSATRHPAAKQFPEPQRAMIDRIPMTSRPILCCTQSSQAFITRN